MMKWEKRKRIIMNLLKATHYLSSSIIVSTCEMAILCPSGMPSIGLWQLHFNLELIA